MSGVVLMLAAAIALIRANSPAAASYHAVWHTPITIGLGSYVSSQSLHFWINDALMAVFILVVGMEFRREIHEGALASLQLATLPLAAALGGVVVPALIHVALNTDATTLRGWAVPTATDIAFAVGVLALLGRSIPGNVRVLLLALAIIDDIVAVLIIAVFYSGGLDFSGLQVCGLGVLMVLGLQDIGTSSAWAYVVPGAVLWLGLMTPVLPGRLREQPLDMAARALGELNNGGSSTPHELAGPLKQLRLAQREVLPPVIRVQMALHPWVAFGLMPLFALANEGATIDGVDLSLGDAQTVTLGVLLSSLVAAVLGLSWGFLQAVRARRSAARA